MSLLRFPSARVSFYRNSTPFSKLFGEKLTVVAGCPRRFGREVHCVLVFDMDGGPAHSRQYAGPPAVPVNKQYKVPAGPTNMTQVFAQKCTSYCFLTGMVGGGGRHGFGLEPGRLGERVFFNREQ